LERGFLLILAFVVPAVKQARGRRGEVKGFSGISGVLG
jgi:hypothetical protein